MEDIGAELSALRPFLVAHARRRFFLSLDDAEDAVQETIIKAWAARHAYQPTVSVKAWSFAILANHIYSLRRRSWRMQYSEDGEWTMEVAPDNAEQVVAFRQTIAAMCDLSLGQIDAIILIARGHSYEAAAEAMGIPEGTVKSRVTRARKALREKTE